MNPHLGGWHRAPVSRHEFDVLDGCVFRIFLAARRLLSRLEQEAHLLPRARFREQRFREQRLREQSSDSGKASGPNNACVTSAVCARQQPSLTPTNHSALNTEHETRNNK